ncbi:hypothetical protein LEP1GSC050_0097 [Leptospira phage vB_LbrZ_5399-LE1]|uniref:Uncharacterized protein n=1 Tax=Leptospira inadai serovar Lyme TaxID=293084 RepID=A0ABX4YGQ8_9LEPT|nr:hypothetical protein [Leptospira inadai]AGS80697.1 hypothetical protein LEP1GSC050_0097 [Leptospira phage vB_LbrZ_5399-LE1]AGS80849.1 hypothetical protein LEP1GSC047_0875 [Leptospira phage vB_LinZ_10-LE1]PNV74355.1 hypothetical protein BES34_014320 [Leptospira inadai serovar Lyme]
MNPVFDFLLSGIASVVRIGKNGPKLKSNNTSLEVRLPDDSSLGNLKIADPINPEDAVTLSYLRDHVLLNFGAPVQNLSALSQILASDRRDKQIREVEDELSFYEFDGNSNLIAPDPSDSTRVILPNDIPLTSPGRWLKTAARTQSHASLLGLTLGNDHPQYQLRSEKNSPGGYASLSNDTVNLGVQLVSGPSNSVLSKLSSIATSVRNWILPDKSGTILIDSDLLVESTARQASDSSIQSNLNLEITNRANSETTINSRLTNLESTIPNLLPVSQKNSPNGVAGLDASGKILSSVIPSGIGGGAAFLLWRQGEPNPVSGLIFSDFPSLYSAISNLQGIKQIAIDSSVSSPVIPTGNYNLKNCIFQGTAVLEISSSGDLIQVSSGVTVSNLPLKLERCTFQVNTSTTPFWSSTGMASLELIDSNIQILGTGILFQIGSTDSFDLVLRNSNLTKASGATGNLLNALGTVIVAAIDGNCSIDPNSVIGTGNLVSLMAGGWNSNTNGEITSSFTGFSGTHSKFNLRTASQIEYDTSIGGNQHVTGTNLQAVIQEINPKATGRLNTKGSIITGDGVGGIIGIPAGNDGDVLIWDSTKSGGIKSGKYTGTNEYDYGTVGAGIPPLWSLFIDWSNGLSQKFTINGNCNVGFLNPESGRNYSLLVVQDSVGNRIISWDSNIIWNGSAPILSTSPKTADLFTFHYSGGKYLGVKVGSFLFT